MGGGGGQGARGGMLLAGLYALLNVSASCSIIFANKAVYTFAHFPFPIALTFIHTCFTAVGMKAFRLGGVFVPKPLGWKQVTPMAAVFCGYIASQNLSLRYNTIGFFQIAKIAITPAILLLQWAVYGISQPRDVKLSIAVLCVGVTVATVTDVSVRPVGFVVACGSIFVTALFQIWMGSKQKEFEVSSNQLLDQYTPFAALFMGTLVPLFEPLGYHTKEGEVSIENEGGTLLGWLRDPELFTTRACVLILISSVLGLLVNLSAMLVIQHTSTLTYNVVGHIKTVVVLAGGVLIFGDGMTLKKLTGITVTMTGIVWYSILKMRASAEAKEKEQALRAAKEEMALLGKGSSVTVGGASVAVDDKGNGSETHETMQALLASKV